MAIYRPIYTCCKTDIFFTWRKNLFFRTVHDCVIGGVFWGFVADYKKQYRIIIGIVCIGSIVVMSFERMDWGQKKEHLPKRS